MRQVNKSRVAIIAAVILVALAIVLLVLWMRPSHHEDNSSLKKQQSVLSASEAQGLERAMMSEDKEAQARVLVPEKRGAQWNARAVIPPGVQLTIDYVHSVRQPDGTAVVPSKLSNSSQTTYMIRLRQENGRWLIVETWKE